jgi:hypothetical protein
MVFPVPLSAGKPPDVRSSIVLPWVLALVVVAVPGSPGTAVRAVNQRSAAPPEHSAPSLTPDQASVDQLSPELRAQLVADLYAYFRFINTPWLRAVCEAFSNDQPPLPVVRLHGDPHLEQYAFTSDSRGLDDFDDSAAGPFVVDLVRFLASVQLALHARGWQDETRRAFDAFFEGYRTTLADPDYLPPDPAVIARMRASHPPTAAAFLAWAESLMQPLAPPYQAALPSAVDALKTYARRARPQLPPQYFSLKRAGLLQMGVGSALAMKMLLRLEGPTKDPNDDVIVEAKRAGDLSGVPCLELMASQAFRVVSGAEQIGRLRHDLLFVMPRISPSRRGLPERWWIRSWDRTYHEVDIDDYQAAREIVEVARDVGAQLGRGHFHDPNAHEADRSAVNRALTDLAPRVTRDVDALTARLLADWAAFKKHIDAGNKTLPGGRKN